MKGLKNVSHRRDDALSRIKWDKLEVMLAAYYRRQGWEVEHVGTGAGRTRFDGGVDLKLRRGSELVLVQAKHWNAKQVPHNAVHELLGIKVNNDATGAIVITSGEFTAAAREAAARQGHVQLIDGDALRVMLGPQLDVLTDSTPPPLPPHIARYADNRTSATTRSTILLVSLAAGALILYALFRLLTAPMFNHRIEVDLPQRVIPPPPRRPAPVRAPDTRLPPAEIKAPSHIEAPMQDAGLREWKRKNAESMRILEENERRNREAEAAAAAR